jgi:lipoprotein LprG
MDARSRLLLLLLLPLIVLTACTGGGEDAKADPEEATPEEVLQLARQTLEETSGVRLSLSTPSLPDGAAGVLSADGLATHAPAFDGTLTVSLAGQSVEVPVVAVDGVVWAQLPFTQGFDKVDPRAYGAPDPATMLDRQRGFPALLTATESPAQGESVRGGAGNSEVLTEYSGTVPGDAVAKVIPSASDDTFDALWQVTDDGELRHAELTGVFYPGTDPLTYTVDFSDYGTEQQITEP